MCVSLSRCCRCSSFPARARLLPVVSGSSSGNLAPVRVCVRECLCVGVCVSKMARTAWVGRCRGGWAREGGRALAGGPRLRGGPGISAAEPVCGSLRHLLLRQPCSWHDQSGGRLNCRAARRGVWGRKPLPAPPQRAACPPAAAACAGERRHRPRRGGRRERWCWAAGAAEGVGVSRESPGNPSRNDASKLGTGLLTSPRCVWGSLFSLAVARPRCL